MKNIKVNDDLHRLLKIRAAQEGLELKQLAELFLREGLKRAPPSPMPAPARKPK